MALMSVGLATFQLVPVELKDKILNLLIDIKSFSSYKQKRAPRPPTPFVFCILTYTYLHLGNS